MRFLLVLAFAALTCASSLVPRPGSSKLDEFVYDLAQNNEEIEYVVDPDDGNVEIDPQFILSWQVKRMIKKFRNEMPCGFPQYGIPPLAPLKVSEGDIHLQEGLVETFDKVFRFRIDGLDNFRINKFKLNVIFSRIKFDFTFKNIDTTADKYVTDTILDAMRQIGLSVEYEGDGKLNFGLTNLRVVGTIHYKMPILWGSTKITSLKTTTTLQKCDSEITGIAGNGPYNRMLNAEIEHLVESGINDNQQLISDKIEETLVPRINKFLKGTDIWTLIDRIFSSDDNEDDPIVTKCVPPLDPWNP